VVGVSRRALAVAAAVLLLALLATGAVVLVVRGRSDACARERFQEVAKRNWEEISRGSAEVAAALEAGQSAEDLAKVSDAAAGMRKQLEEVKSSLEEDSPRGYEDLARMQVDALERLDSFLSGIAEYASADESTVIEGRGILEDKSRRAFSAVNEFLAEAPFELERPIAEFYQAPQFLVEVWTEPGESLSEDAEAAYQAASSFLEADREEDFQKLYGMISTRLKTALDYYNISQEALAKDWRRSWDNRKLVDYYISKKDVSLPQPEQAQVKVVAYVDDGGPVTETVRLVREQGAWKIDSYPFVGWE
jgi:hypothetical protein